MLTRPPTRPRLLVPSRGSPRDSTMRVSPKRTMMPWYLVIPTLQPRPRWASRGYATKGTGEPRQKRRSACEYDPIDTHRKHANAAYRWGRHVVNRGRETSEDTGRAEGMSSVEAFDKLDVDDQILIAKLARFPAGKYTKADELIQSVQRANACVTSPPPRAPFASNIKGESIEFGSRC